MSWNNTDVTPAEGTTDAWGTPAAADAAPADDGWGASGDAGGEGEAETEAPRPSYQPVGITKTPGEHGWANKKDAAYDYDTFNKSSKELADALTAREGGEGEGEASADVSAPDVEPVGAVGGLAPGQWANNAAVYEWDEEYGDVGPRFADLEKQLFGSEFHVKAGIQFDK